MVATRAIGKQIDGPYADPAHHWPHRKDVLVIHLVSPLTLDDRFSAQDFPDALQLPLLDCMTVPRIVSSSMAPTIQAGDSLRLSSPSVLEIGAIIVFRNDTILVCHRITAIDSQGLLSTKGDATLGACEVVQPNSVIGVVTGVIREGKDISLGHNSHMSSAATQPNGFPSPVRPAVVRFVAWSIRAFANFRYSRPILAGLLRWTTTIDVFASAPLRSLRSHTRIASYTLRMFSNMGDHLFASFEQRPTSYVLRLGPWRLAQYDPATQSLLLRQYLQDAGLESLVRSMLR
jgi:signal peptidase I